MNVLLPVAGVEVNWVALLGLGLVVGFLAGLLGVGGGFIMTPLLMSLGVPPVSAVGSSIGQLAGMASCGASHHWRAGNVDAKLGVLLVAGGVMGSFGGTLCVRALRLRGSFGLWVRVLYVVLLGVIGAYMLFESSRAGGGGEGRSRLSRALGRLPWAVEFSASRLKMTPLVPVGFGALIGALSAVMGIGGGVVAIPLLIYVVGVPTHVAVGTDLFHVFWVSLAGTVFQAAVNRSVDVVLVFILLVGSTIGVTLGSFVSVRTRSRKLRRIFALVALGVTAKMVHELATGKTAHAEAVAPQGAIGAFACEHAIAYGLVVALSAGVFGLVSGMLLGRARKR